MWRRWQSTQKAETIGFELRSSRGQLEPDASIDRDNDARKFNMLAHLFSPKSFRFDRPMRKPRCWQRCAS
jgi:hypothetical protein